MQTTAPLCHIYAINFLVVTLRMRKNAARPLFPVLLLRILFYLFFLEKQKILYIPVHRRFMSQEV